MDQNEVFEKSKIFRNILDTGHLIDTSKSFKVNKRQHNCSLLKLLDNIKRQKNNLFAQKETVVNLSLPW